MAEWLRRVIRNHLGSSRAGSNPVQCDHFYVNFAQNTEIDPILLSDTEL